MSFLFRAALLAAMLVVSATQLSCNVNEYCLNCAKGDGGNGGDGGSGSDGGSDIDASDAGQCIPTGVEVCNGKDDDCNGQIDDNIAGVGQACANQLGECAGGVMACVNGTMGCTKKPSPEVCDNKDNDCDGVPDNGNPGGGGTCGSNMGVCTPGTKQCVNGNVICVGGSGPTQVPETSCDAKDNDCDGQFDENLNNLGTCGHPTVGECVQGTLMCQGGGVVCVGALNPSIELCDHKDNDCDGVKDNGFNLVTDPQNCGDCGIVCNLPHANAGCNATPPTPNCTVASCKAGYHDNNHVASDGCEFGPCFISGVESCDGVDNDCDGVIDEDVGTPPAICATAGECAGTTATCTGGAWVCNYPSSVSVNAQGQIIPETTCDMKDNDCDTRVDEGQPNLDQPCHDSGIGECQGTGFYKCDTNNLDGPAVCKITVQGKMSKPEECDNKDNDCDGVIDNGGATSSLVGQEFVDIGNGVKMMKYEASKPDADGTTPGNVQTIACSKLGALPWTNVTYPQAAVACASIGARLCTEQEWHRSCSAVAPSTYPIALPLTGAVSQVVEAEDYYANTSATDTTNGNLKHAWVEDYTAGYSGISAMQANPDPGTGGSNIANASVLANAPHLDFRFNFQRATTYHLWALISRPNANSNIVALTIDNGAISNNNRITSGTDNTWQWIQSTTTYAPTAAQLGVHTLSVYMVKDGVKVDAVAITDSNTAPALPANSKGGHWSYAMNPNTYQAMTCDGHDYDPNADATLTTGSLTSCIADGAYDLSGNVKEWALAHLPGQNPIRGGASNNTGEGISCSLNFTLADDTFFFPNVGFRCCK